MAGDILTDFTTLPAMIEAAAALYGEAIAVEDGDTRLTYRDFNRARRRIARALMAAGVAHGDRVMLWMPNGWTWIATAFAITSIGGVLVPVNTRFKGGEVATLAERSGAEFFVSCGTFLGSYYPDMLDASTRARMRMIVVADDARPGDHDWPGFIARADGIAEAALDARQAAVRSDDICDMLYTSGTTGYPKGVMYAHQQCLRTTDAWATRVGLRRGDRVLVIPPFFHSFGYRAGAIVSLMRGATLLPHRTYDAEDILTRVAAEKVSVIPGPPAIFHGMLQHPRMREFDRSSLRLAVTGGAVVPEELVRRMRTDLGFSGVVTGYGLTECGGYGTMCSAGDSDETIASSAGKPFPDTEVAIIDAEGRPLPQGTHGEIVIRGYLTMRGYFQDAEATAKTIDADGWLHTGDVGYFDAGGNLRIEDRLKDLYITGGFNCYPAEIERMLSEHPAIGVVSVIGVPDDRLGEVGRAYVILRPGTAASAAEIIDWARGRMANYKVPRSVVFCDSLPMSPQGKVLKTALRAEG